MSDVLTLVASSDGAALSEKHFKKIAAIIEHYNLHFSSKIIWLSKKIAAECSISGKAQSALVAHLREELAADKIDFFITPNENRQKKLLLADMDSTIVTTETLDELAAHAGIKDKVSEITARAMNGELDFHQALRARIALLKDLPSKAVMQTLEQTQLSLGADILVKTMRKSGATCVLVSGGFTLFTEEIAVRCGFNFHHGNALEIKDEKLTGNVVEPILDKHAKVNFLSNYTQDLNLTMQDCLAIGDGANDLPMLKEAGLGIGYRPKDAVKSEMHNCILYGDLTAALYAQGYSQEYIEG